MASGGAEWLAAVRAALDDLRSITKARSGRRVLSDRAASLAAEWSAAHRAFDRSLYGECQSAWLLRFIDTMSERCERYRLAASELKNVDNVWLVEHEVIFAAVEARDEEAALSALRKHLADTAVLLEDYLGGAIQP
jgi:DNA-binding GntR family transcriptional regulator